MVQAAAVAKAEATTAAADIFMPNAKLYIRKMKIQDELSDDNKCSDRSLEV